MRYIKITSFNDQFTNLLTNLGWWKPVMLEIKDDNKIQIGKLNQKQSHDDYLEIEEYKIVE